MANGFEDLVNFVNDYINAVEQGVKRAISSAPLLIRQDFAAKARTHLHSSLQEYMAALDIDLKDNMLVVTLDNSWLAKAVEDGQDPFSLKDTLLNSPKAKLSKLGFRYMSIPLSVSKSATSGTDKGKKLQEKIKEALKDPIFNSPKIGRMRDGSIKMTEELNTADPQLKGIYRIRNFENMEAIGSQPRASQYIMFRTISQNPLSRSQWDHPGIQPRKLFPKVESWANMTLSSIMVDIISDEVNQFLEGR